MRNTVATASYPFAMRVAAFLRHARQASSATGVDAIIDGVMGRDLTGRRMGSSRLTGTPFDDAGDVVRWHGAMQAQDFGPAKWSIAQRSRRLQDPDIDLALAAGSILRTHVMRPTWHFVAPDDVRWLLALTGPRVQQHNAPRCRQLGLDGKTFARAEDLIASALEGGRHLTRAALSRVLRDGGVDASGQRMPYLLMHCELEALICSGPLDGKQQTYALLDERVPKNPPLDRDQALLELVRRYLGSHGPATVRDLRWWSSLTVADIESALSMLGSEVEHRTVEGLTVWWLAIEAARPPRGRRAHLLQAYDEVIVGYAESRFLGDPLADHARAAWKNRTLPSGVVLMGSRVCGHWRRKAAKDSVAVEIVTYEGLQPRDVRAIERAVARLGRFLARPLTVEIRRR